MQDRKNDREQGTLRIFEYYSVNNISGFIFVGCQVQGQNYEREWSLFPPQRRSEGVSNEFLTK